VWSATRYGRLSRTISAIAVAGVCAMLVSAGTTTPNSYQARTLSEWVSAVEDQDPVLRARAADALSNFGRKGVSALIKAMNDSDPAVREVAILGLHLLAPVGGHEAVPAISQRLTDPDREVRHWAIITLAQYGQAARSAVPALLEALRGSDAQTGAPIVETLGRIGSGANDVEPALKAALEDNSVPMRKAAVQALADVGELTDVLRATRDPDQGVRGTAYLNLHGLGSKLLIEAVIQNLLDPDPAVRADAASQVRAIIDRYRGIIGALNSSKTSPSLVRAYRSAFLSNAALRQAAAVLRPQLFEATRDRDPAVREKAEASLRALESTTPRTQ
jgi:HEAT repeat protein